MTRYKIPARLRYTALVCLSVAAALLLLPQLVAMDGEYGADFLIFLGRFHIVVLHLPIAWLVLVPILEYLGYRSGLDACKTTARYALLLAACAAVVTVLFGVTLASADGYAGRLVTWHMWAGIVTAVTAILALLCKEISLILNDRRARIAYAGFLSVSLLAVTIGGHLGGSLVQGEGYLTDKAPAIVKALLGIGAEEAAPVVSHDSPIYASIVQPIFKEHCLRCHNPDKLKGNFRLDTLEGLLHGGKSGKAAIVPGEIADSELLRRINLPRQHKKAMPPKEQDGLRQAEIDLLQWWVSIGAPPESAIKDLPSDQFPEEIAALVDELMEATAVAVAKVEAIDPELLAESAQRLFAEQGIKVYPVSRQLTDGLRVITRNRNTALDAAAVKALLPLAPYVVSMDLSGTPVNSDALAYFSEFAALEKLNLNHARINDVDLKPLARLPKLEHLNLLGTAVTDAAVEILAEFHTLKYLNLYATAVSDAARSELQLRLPVCTVVSGAFTNPDMADAQGLTLQIQETR